jgi:hypothetical protein
VARLLYSSGIETELESDFGLDGGGETVVRATACTALRDACIETGKCDEDLTMLDCVDAPMSTGALQKAIALLEPDAGFITEFDVEPVTDKCAWLCSDPVDLYYAGNGSAECLEPKKQPRYQYLTLPQPENLGCLGCTVVPDLPITSVYASLAPEFTGKDVTNAIVELTMEDGTKSRHDLGNIDLFYGTTSELRLSNMPAGTIRSGEVTLSINTGVRTVVTTDALLIGESP